MDHLLPSMRATSTPGASRSASGMRGHARPADIFAGDDIDRDRRLEGGRRFLGWRSHFDLRKLFEAQVLQRLRSRVVRGGLRRIVGAECWREQCEKAY